MARASLEVRIRALLLYIEGKRTQKKSRLWAYRFELSGDGSKHAEKQGRRSSLRINPAPNVTRGIVRPKKKHHHMVLRMKAKPQPYKRFQRKHVDSMWQDDTFQFRISSVGKVYITGFIDDRSRYRAASGVYLHRGADEAIDALRLAHAKKRIPREMYLENGKQFIAKEFRNEARNHGIKLLSRKRQQEFANVLRGQSLLKENRSFLLQDS